MKNTIQILSLCAIVTLFAACGTETEQTALQENDNEVELVEISKPETAIDAYLYVTASSGLSLRKHDNLNSDKLAVMPYGTKLKVLAIEENEKMNVAGIRGGMNKVAYNNKEGYAFNGYLSELFPPEKGMNAKQYIEDLKATHSTTSYFETTGGTASNPSNTETVLLPTTKWYEAYAVAQKLYDIPLSMAFPKVSGKDFQTIKNAKKPDHLSLSELKVERNDNMIQQIIYSQALQRYDSSVTITKQGTLMKIKWTGIAK